MILGIGNDIVDIDRVRRIYEKNEMAFPEEILSPEEILKLAQRSGSGRAEYLAGRWAAKEALGKALGTGLGGNCSPSEITVRNLSSGAPEMTATGRTAEFLLEKKVEKIWVTISHERHFAIATVLLESADLCGKT